MIRIIVGGLLWAGLTTELLVIVAAWFGGGA